MIFLAGGELIVMISLEMDTNVRDPQNWFIDMNKSVDQSSCILENRLNLN